MASAGQSAAFLDSAHFFTKLTLQPGGQYLIAVVNTDTTHAVTEDFTLVGLQSASSNRVGGAVIARSLRTPPAHDARYNAGPELQQVAIMRRLEKNHVKMLNRNAQIFQRFRSAGAAGMSGLRASNIRKSISQTVGTVNKIYVAKAFGATCTDVDSIGARTVAVGQHVIVLADTNRTNWPDSLRDSSFYQKFADEYDATTFGHITSVIGNPLAYDASLSHIGKITVTISPVLNNFGGGIVAFVDGCDFFPVVLPNGSNQSTADLDNFTEMFYYWAPGTNGFDLTFWEALMRATAAHETKHIVSYTDRIINNSQNFEEIWLEEGLAQESSEIWERKYNNTTWKGHATFAQTVACEIDLFRNGTGCDPNDTKPYALLGSHLPFLFGYLQQESTSPTGLGLGTNTESNYGAGWEFARWATDQYATSGEPAFIQSLVNEPALTGMANLAKQTHKSAAELLVYWNLATAIIDTTTYTAADARTTIPSYNFGDIFFVGQTKLHCTSNGVTTPCGLFTTSGTPVFPVSPDPVVNGPINVTVTGMPGTTAKYFLLSSRTGGVETLELKSGAGGAIPAASGFRVGIIRVQ